MEAPPLPRERLNPTDGRDRRRSGSRCGSGVTPFPVVEGGTAIVLHRLSTPLRARHADPYRAPSTRSATAATAADLAAGEQAAATDARALAAYRAGRACHPLLPYADWAAAGPRSTGSARSSSPAAATHQAARTLGFVPTHGIAAALEMAHGRAGGDARIGFLLAPPYFPLAGRSRPSPRRGTSCGPARSSRSSFAGPSSAIVPVSST